jgi:hypothetical protein
VVDKTINPESNTSDDDHAEEILLEKRDSVCVFKNNYLEEFQKDNASFRISSKGKFGSSIFFDTS